MKKAQWRGVWRGGGGGENQEKQQVLDKYDNIRKENPAEKYTPITFAAQLILIQSEEPAALEIRIYP